MSDQGEGRPLPNFVEGPSKSPRRRAAPPGDQEATGTGVRARFSALLGRLPVPLPVATAVCAVVAVLLVGVIVVRIIGSGTASADKMDAAPSSTAPRATAPVATTIPPVTLPRSPEEDAASRAAFIETMKRMGLTAKQADCAADKVQMTIGWAVVAESLMEPGKSSQLEAVMMACVKG